MTLTNVIFNYIKPKGNNIPLPEFSFSLCGVNTPHTKRIKLLHCKIATYWVERLGKCWQIKLQCWLIYIQAKNIPRSLIRF